MEGAIGTGFVYAATFVLMGLFMGLLPASEALSQRLVPMILVLLSLGLSFVDGFLWSLVLLGSRGLGIYEVHVTASNGEAEA